MTLTHSTRSRSLPVSPADRRSGPLPPAAAGNRPAPHRGGAPRAFAIAAFVLLLADGLTLWT